jgi:hypothetical protein
MRTVVAHSVVANQGNRSPAPVGWDICGRVPAIHANNTINHPIGDRYKGTPLVAKNIGCRVIVVIFAIRNRAL